MHWSPSNVLSRLAWGTETASGDGKIWVPGETIAANVSIKDAVPMKVGMDFSVEEGYTTIGMGVVTEISE